MLSNHSVLDVLSFMFDYLFEGKEPINDRDLKAQLSAAGFDKTGIDNALNWLDNISLLQQGKTKIIKTKHKSIRLYSPLEQQKIDIKGRNFLYFLESVNQLNPTQRELIINQAMSLGSGAVSLEDIKWIVMMVLGNENNATTDYDFWLETLMTDHKQHTLQ